MDQAAKRKRGRWLRFGIGVVVDAEVLKQFALALFDKVEVEASKEPVVESGVVMNIVEDCLADQDFATSIEFAFASGLGVFKTLFTIAENGFSAAVLLLHVGELLIEDSNAFDAVHERGASATVRQPSLQREV